MSATPIWFGGHERPMFGWLHVPDSGAARAGVVLTPTLAVEAMSAYPAQRLLAGALSAVGFAVLRFDYPGTGDSGATLDEIAPEAFVDSTGQAVALLRSLGARRIGMVGLRFGALVAATACAKDGGIDALALWDPPASGRAYLREQRALKQLSIGDTPAPPDGVLELLGMSLPERHVEQLSALSIKKLEPPLAAHVLVVSRPDRPATVADPLALARVGGEALQADDLAGFLDVLPDQSVLPLRSLEELRRFFERSLPDEEAPFSSVAAAPVQLGHGESGGAVIERTVILGARQLFAILTEPEAPAVGPTVVFLNAGRLHHIGPARLWVDLARRLADSGIRSVRFDLSGLGDSGQGPDQDRQVSYPLEALEDIATVSTFVAPPDGREVIYVGLCAGAYHSIEAGIASGVRGSCAINPILNFDPPELAAGDSKDPMRHAAQPYRGLFRTLSGHPRLGSIGERIIPSWLWSLLDRTNLQPSPARGLAGLVDAGTDVLLLCGEIEARPFRYRAGGTMRRLAKSGRLRFEVLENSDHTLFGADARARASEVVIAHILAACDVCAPRGETARTAEPVGELPRLEVSARAARGTLAATARRSRP